jgi:hypothetical protein
MAKVSDIYQSVWLKAEDLGGAGRKVRIEAINVQQFDNQQTNTKENKIVVAFVGKQKRLICNKMQAGALGKMFGDDTDNWLGREVVLTPIPTPNGKETIAVTAVPVIDKESDGAIPF